MIGAGMGGAAKPAAKLVIRSLKPRQGLSPEYEAQAWEGLREAVGAVQRAAPTLLTQEDLFRSVETLCEYGGAPALFDKLYKLLDAHAQSVVAELAANLGPSPQAYLPTLGGAWQAYTTQLLAVRDIFMHLDRTHVHVRTRHASLYDAGLELLRNWLSSQPSVPARAVDGLLTLVRADRDGEPVDRRLAATVVRALSALGIYTSVLEPPLLEATTAYYAAEGGRLSTELSVQAYLKHAERRLEEEAERCDVYLGNASRPLLTASLQATLLEAHMAALLERGLDGMLEEVQSEDLARAYRLCTAIGALEGLRGAFKSHVQRVGGAWVADSAREAELVPRLLAWKATLDGLVAGPFVGAEAFSQALKEGFEHFINQRHNKPAELLARHMDGLLRGGSARGAGANAGPADAETALDAALVLFRFIQGKDVFEAFYRRDMARRLLGGRSTSLELERACIAKLRQECGAAFTSKLEGMFKDVETSQDLTTEFREASLSQAAGSDAQAGTACDTSAMSVSVLTLGFWPGAPPDAAALPPELAAGQTAFSEYYLGRHSGRRLAWANSLGSCVVRVQFAAGARELTLSLFQGLVLMQFVPGAGPLGLPALATATGLEDGELRRTLQSLACGRERVLCKEPRGRDVGDADTFTFNDAYTSAKYRVRVGAILAREAVDDATRTTEGVMQDRQYQIDAAVVRVMKTRRTLSHKLLVNELMLQLKFPVNAAALKKRIESLIEREYLERDPRDAQVYNYLA